jgi:hypothetical protein
MRKGELKIISEQVGSAARVTVERGGAASFVLSIHDAGDVTMKRAANALTLKKDNTTIVAFTVDGDFVLQVVNKAASPKQLRITIAATVTSLPNNAFTFTDDSGETVSVTSDKSSLSFHGDGTVGISTIGDNSMLTFAYSGVSMFSAQSEPEGLSGEGYSVGPGERMPEFSIAVFDDSTRSTPRPVRLGVPVISTVPVFRDGLGESELVMLEAGLGTEKRRMYFKIISSRVIPEDVDPVLRIYLPGGLDTVLDPVAVTMTRQASDDDSRSVFHASYEFHQEDTVNYVDGYAYLSVYIPMEVTAELPVTFDVTSDGEPLADPYRDDPESG